MDPKKLIIQQLERLIRTSKEPFPVNPVPEEPQTSRSSAISLAMKALQDQVDMLEARCALLSTQLEGETAQFDLSKKENCSLIDTCRKLTEGQRDLQEEIRLLKLEKQRESGQMQIVTDHGRVLQAENERNMQNYALDREKWQLDIEHLNRQLEERCQNERKLTESVTILSKEKGNLEMELAAVKKSLSELRRKEEKQRLSLEKALSKAESEAADTRKRHSNSLRELEKDNKSLAELCKTQKDTIARLRRENAQQIKTKPAGNLPPKPASKLKTPRRQSFSATLERQEDLQEVDERQVEAELSLCNAKYTALLQKMQQEGGDGKTVRRELSALAAEMEGKSELLYSLKQQRRNA